MDKESLSISDRLLLLDVLPQTGDITTIRIVRTLREDLSFTEEEHAKFGLSINGSEVTWKSNEKAEIEIGSKARQVISNAFKQLSSEKKLRAEHIELYERFVEE